MTKAVPESGALIAYLRSVTRLAHNRLEGGLGLLDDLDLYTYERILARFYGFWRVWQPQAAALLDEDALTQPRGRLHLLVADLSALGVSDDALAALPLCPLTNLQDNVEALGSLYVMEGSSLGGRVIQRNVERRLESAGQASCSYFNGYGADTGVMWRSFLARLDRVPEIEMERVGRGAMATFENLGAWLDGLPAKP